LHVEIHVQNHHLDLTKQCVLLIWDVHGFDVKIWDYLTSSCLHLARTDFSRKECIWFLPLGHFLGLSCQDWNPSERAPQLLKPPFPWIWRSETMSWASLGRFLHRWSTVLSVPGFKSHGRYLFFTPASFYFFIKNILKNNYYYILKHYLRKIKTKT
jgi:hypothetical protein